MESRDSDTTGQPTPDSNGQPQTFPVPRVTSTLSTTAGERTPEQSSVETPARILPATPSSTNGTPTSQLSSKSKYNRRFDKRFLATPSSNRSGSPTPEKEPSIYSSPKAPEPPSEPWKPLTSPRNLPSSLLRAEAEPYFPQPSYHQVSVPGVGYYANTMGAGLLPPGPQNRPHPYSYYSPATSSGPTMPFTSNFQSSPSSPGPSSNTSPAYNPSPAYSYTSARYGGEAYHHIPVGINPSPPVTDPGCYAHDTLGVMPPPEPFFIAEHPSLENWRDDPVDDLLDEPPTKRQRGQTPPKPPKKDKVIKRKFQFWH